MKKIPTIRMRLRSMTGDDHLNESSEYRSMQFSPMHQIRDVIQHLHYCLQLTEFESIIICKDAKMLKQNTFLGTIADTTGYVEVSWTRLDIKPPWEEKQAALSRARWHAEQDEWGAWSRALSDADYWETKEFEHSQSRCSPKQ